MNIRNHFLNNSTKEQFETARLAVLSGLDIMTDKEKKAFAALPEVLTVYRGGQFSKKDLAENGFHWSLSPHVAERFATSDYLSGKFCYDPLLITASVRKCDVVAYFNREDGDEQELVIRPENVTNKVVSIVPLDFYSDEERAEYNNDEDEDEEEDEPE